MPEWLTMPKLETLDTVEIAPVSAAPVLAKRAEISELTARLETLEAATLSSARVLKNAETSHDLGKINGAELEAARLRHHETSEELASVKHSLSTKKAAVRELESTHTKEERFAILAALEPRVNAVQNELKQALLQAQKLDVQIMALVTELHTIGKTGLYHRTSGKIDRATVENNTRLFTKRPLSIEALLSRLFFEAESALETGVANLKQGASAL